MIEVLVVIKNIILIMLLFGASIFVHELGHFLVAKKLGFKIKTFSIGFGKAIWSRMIDGVEWKIGWLPLGGYVALPQMDHSGGNRLEGVEGAEAASSGYIHPWKKIAVAVAGAAMNIVFAFCLAIVVWKTGILWSSEKLSPDIGYVLEGSPADKQGIKVGDTITRTRQVGSDEWTTIKNYQRFMIEAALKGELEVEFESDGELRTAILTTEKTLVGNLITYMGGTLSCRIGQFSDDSPAQRAGFQVGDLITKLNDVVITDTRQFSTYLKEVGGSPIRVEVVRDGEPQTITFQPRAATAEEAEKGYGPYMIGISWDFLVKAHPTPGEQMNEAAFFVVRVLKAFGSKDERKHAAQGIQGPVGINVNLYKILSFGFIQGIGFIILINVNLAILNLMPIPILDGGHVCFSLYEWIRGRAVPEKVVIGLTNVFLVLFLTVFLAVSYQDTVREWKIFQMTKAAEAQAEAAEEPEKTEPAPEPKGDPAPATP